jgi:hypothetical protein
MVTFFIVLTSLPPSTDAMKADAAALVLPGSELTHTGSNEGATIIVGWDRFSVAEFEDERNLDVVHQLVIERASELGWSVDRAEAVPLRSHIEASRPLTNASIRVFPRSEGGERIEAVAGQITVSRNEVRRSVLFWGSVVLGGIAGAWLPRRLGSGSPA